MPMDKNQKHMCEAPKRNFPFFRIEITEPDVFWPILYSPNFPQAITFCLTICLYADIFNLIFLVYSHIKDITLWKGDASVGRRQKPIETFGRLSGNQKLPLDFH